MTCKMIGVVGMGLLGRGIAACFLAKGFNVVVHSLGEDWRNESRRYINAAISDLVNHDCADKNLPAQWISRYHETDVIAEMADCEFVIESVPEDLNTKRSVLKQLESAIGPAVPIATNTSSIPVALLQREMRYPNRFIGMHWAAPCYATRFLEVIRGEQTDDQTARITMELARTIGKDPSLLNKDIAGFIVNRMAYAMYREAFALLEAGVADIATIDRSFRHAFGLWASIAGPFRWMDLTGLPAYANAMERLFPQLSNVTEIPDTMRRLIDAGAKGIANGQGFYGYTPEQATEWEQRLIDNVWRVNAADSSGDLSCD